jgi:hypothetical protein
MGLSVLARMFSDDDDGKDARRLAKDPLLASPMVLCGSLWDVVVKDEL